MELPTLRRGLNARHIRFMALGSAIGTGLFYGSAAAIQRAGPSVLLAYLIAGAAVYLMMRALGEMAALHFPVRYWPQGQNLSIAFMLFIFAVMASFPDTRTALGIGAAWLVLLSFAYGLWVRPGRDVPGEPEPS